MAKNRFAPPDEWAGPVCKLVAFNLLAHNLDRITKLELAPAGLLNVYTVEEFPCEGRPLPPGRCTPLPPLSGFWDGEPFLSILPDTSRARWAVRVFLVWGEKRLQVEFATIPHTDPVAAALRVVLREHFGLEYPAEELPPPGFEILPVPCASDERGPDSPRLTEPSAGMPQ